MAKDLTDKNVAMVIANENFRDEEYFEPKKVFEDAGIKVITVAKTTAIAKGVLGGKAKPDKKLDEINIDDYDALIFIGGSGGEIYWKDKVAHSLCKSAVEKNKVLGAICIAPATLAYAGVLKAKRANAFSSIVSILKENGAIVTNNPVECDGKIVTATGPKAATSFGKKILELLSE